MNRPPSRNGSRKTKGSSNVVPLFPSKQKPVKSPKAPKIERKVLKQQSKRLSIHERNAKSAVTKLRPGISFGRKITFAIVGSITALAIFVVVAVYSPLLAIRNIEVVGASRVSSDAIQKDLRGLKGKPLPQISSELLAAKLSKYQLIDSVSAVALPPSGLRVVIVERSAIAIVKINNISYLYDAAGVQLGRASITDRLPSINNAGNPASSESFAQAIRVILSLPMGLLPKISSISAASKDNVILNLRSRNQKVLWGDDSDPALKAEVLSALMKHYVKHYGTTFDVSSPSQPSVY